MAEVTTTEETPEGVQTAEELRQKIDEEYGQYVATEPIYIDGALAFAEGHPVPVSHVKRFGFDKGEKSVKSTKEDKAESKASGGR